MPLQKLQFKPGVNRENTRYTSEGGWYECDKVRFRQGMPEKIGGWVRISDTTFQGVCRSLHNWVTLNKQDMIGVGTNLKFYIENGGGYYDITPIRATTAAGDVTFAATDGSTTITVTDVAHGALEGDFVTFSGAVSLGGNITAEVLNQEYQVGPFPTTDTYTITATATANSSDTGNGGSSVVGAYQLNTGPEFAEPVIGWSAGEWGENVWGTGGSNTEALRLWSQTNFGEDLVFGPRGGGVYYWDATTGITVRAQLVSDAFSSTASNVPVVQNRILVSDISRFVFCLGTNPLGSTTLDPMLIRWADQESVSNWTPAASNQAGDLRLSNGSEIITATQARQEVLVWTDSALYSLQYVGAPAVWGAQLVGENTSTASQNCVAYANGVAYWMGKDKFYKYDGRTQPLRCDIRRYIFNDFNSLQYDQVFAGTNESFHEIWWFYCSSGSQTANRYAVYNYQEDIWYYGTLSRTAWIDSGLREAPLAATYSYNLVDHEQGTDDNQTTTPAAIAANISSAQFDIEDGHQFAFIWRVIPDITFEGSTAAAPAATMTLLPLASSGAGYNSPLSEGGSNNGTITRSAVLPVEAFTQQLNTRVRGRQLAVKIESTGEGVTWQLGTPRIDMRADGRR